MNKKTIAIIVIFVIVCGGAFGGWMYRSAQIDKTRANGIKELHAAVVLDDYREAQQEDINKILADSEAKIKTCKDQKAVDAIISDAEASIADVKTSAELDVEEGSAALDKAVSPDDYRDKQKKQVTKILDDAKASIAESDSPEAIQGIIKDAKSKIAKIKTDKQLTAAEKKAEQEAAAKAAAEAEAARAAAQAEAARKAAAAAAQKQQSSGSNNSDGCVSDDAANYY